MPVENSDQPIVEVEEYRSVILVPCGINSLLA